MNNSDNIKMNSLFNKVGKRFASTTLLLVAVVSLAFAQEPYRFMEGSTHVFSVQPGNPNSTLQWGMFIDPYKGVPMNVVNYLIDNPKGETVAVTFDDISRITADTVYLVVAETAPNSCTTKRALQIILEPNNMYFDFALNDTTDNCFSFGDDYLAEVAVGMDFNYRSGEDYSPIPESRFPLKVKYTVLDITNGNVVRDNNADYVEILYNEQNAYSLVVSGAVGDISRTIEYELQITDVVDNYGTTITHDEHRRLQIRILNHLPQTGGMDMALAYVISPIIYNGGL